MGSEISRMYNPGNQSNLLDSAARSEVGLPNPYTPPPFVVAQYCPWLKPRSMNYQEFVAYLMHPQTDSKFRKLVKYLKAFLMGGIIGAFLHSFYAMHAPTQYLPFQKLEEYLGESKRLNFFYGK